MQNEIKEILSEVLFVKLSDIQDNTKLDDIIKSSMDVVELIAVLSNKYDLSVNPKEMDNIKIVKDLIDYIEKTKGTTIDKKSLDKF